MKITRRFFLWSALAASGGLALGVAAPRARRWLRNRHKAQPLSTTGASAWLEIAPTGAIRLYCNATEMGQGVWSALAQLVCEELDAEWSTIKVEMAPVDRAYFAPWGYGTGGSRSVRGMFDMMRKIGAAARIILVEAAAHQWQVPVSECQSQQGTIRHTPSGRQLQFGDVAAAAAALTPPSDPDLKTRDQWQIIGQSPLRVDTLAKVDGSATYGMDLRLPDMRFAAVLHCPVLGGKLASVDHAAAKAIGGVEQVLELDDAVAVVASNTWAAMQGVKALQPEWNVGSHANVSSTQMLEQFRQTVKESPGELIANDSAAKQAATNVDTALSAATLRISASYDAPLIAHAQMEPMNTTAWVTQDRAEFWAPTQQQLDLREEAAETLGLAAEQIIIHTPLLGGGFGRRLKNDYAIEAALIARQVGAPVQVVWSRSEDFSKGYFRPAAAARFDAGLDAQGKVQALAIHVASLDANPRLGGFPEQPYDIAARALRYTGIPHGIRTGSWRSVDMSQNTFFLESFLDECAQQGQHDPLDFRLQLLHSEQRAQRVLNAVAELADWQNRKAQGRHLGIAFAAGFHSLTAQIAEVQVVDGRVRIERIYVAVDCGTAVSPDNIAAQLQGGILMALSAALDEEITVADGRVQQTNFDTYSLLRMAHAPDIAIKILESPEAPIGGVGEVGVPPTAPAVANAIFAATGIRLRSLPLLRDERVRWAMRA